MTELLIEPGVSWNGVRTPFDYCRNVKALSRYSFRNSSYLNTLIYNKALSPFSLIGICRSQPYCYRTKVKLFYIICLDCYNSKRIKLRINSENRKQKHGSFDLMSDCSHLLLSGRDSLVLRLKNGFQDIIFRGFIIAFFG